jgi:hypothetical protein
MGTLVLNEIRFLPGPDAGPFIELKNGGGAPLPSQSIVLRNHLGEALEHPDAVPQLEPEQVWLIVLGQANAETEAGLSIGAPEFLDATSGSLGLESPDGELLDQVSWGLDRPGVVRMGRGGVPSDPEPGMSIGRPPGSYRTTPHEWLTWRASQTTPGEANPFPAAEVLLPANGAILPGPEIQLGWYSVPGVTAYRVEVAQDPEFAALVFEETTGEPPVAVESLSPGRYWWRVTTSFDGANASPSSPVQSFSVDPALAAAAGVGRPARPREGTAAQEGEPQEKSLAVPMIYQQKDTRMLFLETPAKEVRAGHPWDGPHAGFAFHDPMDSGNCALASIVMINRFFGGELSQDRLGYELLGSQSPGPEHDLMEGQGVSPLASVNLMAFALGVEVGVEGVVTGEDSEELWEVLVDDIDAGRPLKAGWTGHSVVVTGYRITADGTRMAHVNDPSLGPYWVAFIEAEFISYNQLKGTPTAPRSDEPEISMNSDEDDVVDFDEIFRFGTNPRKSDTDHDGLWDKIDIAASVFLPGWGYGATRNLKSRDYDGDELRMELDPDNDDGGCLDGVEDLDQDGEYEWPEDETFNFEELDDTCWKLDITHTFNDAYGHTVYHYVGNFQVVEGRRLEGSGSALLDHDGKCYADRFYEPFQISGTLEDPSPEPGDETILLDAFTPVESEEPLEGGGAAGGQPTVKGSCTLGDVIEEGFTVDLANLPPEQVEVHLGEDGTGEATYETQSAFSDRGPGDFVVQVEKPSDP